MAVVTKERRSPNPGPATTNEHHHRKATDMATDTDTPATTAEREAELARIEHGTARRVTGEPSTSIRFRIAKAEDGIKKSREVEINAIESQQDYEAQIKGYESVLDNREAELAEITKRAAVEAEWYDPNTIRSTIVTLLTRIKRESQAEYDARASREEYEAKLKGWEAELVIREGKVAAEAGNG